MSYIQRNKALGAIREKRVKEFLTKQYKWKVIKTNNIIDKYHAIDFLAKDNNDNLICVQVKSIAIIKEPFEPKAINYAKFHKAQLYYFYLGKRYNSKIYIKKVNLNEIR